MNFTNKEVRNALKEATTRLEMALDEHKKCPASEKDARHEICREELATVAALNFLIAARKKKRGANA